jgi:hypothetical protein
MSDATNRQGTSLGSWQRASILAAVSFLRDEFGDPPVDERARVVHDGLLEVLDPMRRASRLQQEMTDAARLESLMPKSPRSYGERRQWDRRDAYAPRLPEGTVERRRAERRSGSDRRQVGRLGW